MGAKLLTGSGSEVREKGAPAVSTACVCKILTCGMCKHLLVFFSFLFSFSLFLSLPYSSSSPTVGIGGYRYKQLPANKQLVSESNVKVTVMLTRRKSGRSRSRQNGKY